MIQRVYFYNRTKFSLPSNLLRICGKQLHWTGPWKGIDLQDRLDVLSHAFIPADLTMQYNCLALFQPLYANADATIAKLIIVVACELISEPEGIKSGDSPLRTHSCSIYKTKATNPATRVGGSRHVFVTRQSTPYYLLDRLKYICIYVLIERCSMFYVLCSVLSNSTLGCLFTKSVQWFGLTRAV